MSNRSSGPDSSDIETCPERLRALADGTRLWILLRLLDGPRRVAELNEGGTVEQSLLSHHLRVLREAGLVESEREGKGRRYRLARGIRGSRRRRAINLGCCELRF